MRRKYSKRDRERFLAEMRRTGDAVGAVALRMGVSNGTAYRWWEAERGEQRSKAPAAIQFAALVSLMLPPLSRVASWWRWDLRGSRWRLGSMHSCSAAWCAR